MGQYHYVVNLTKKEYLHPHKFADGLKLREFGASGEGTMFALAILLSNSRNRGGGDLQSKDTEYYSRWAGDRIVVAGDYAEKGDAGETSKKTLYEKCQEGTYTDISESVKALIPKD